MTSGRRAERLFAHHVELMPGFKDYETATDRELPVVVLHRALPPGMGEPDEPVIDP